MQAAVVAMTEGRVGLEEMKAINLSCSDDQAPDLAGPESREGAILVWGAVLALIEAVATPDAIAVIPRDTMTGLRGKS